MIETIILSFKYLIIDPLLKKKKGEKKGLKANDLDPPLVAGCSKYSNDPMPQ